MIKRFVLCFFMVIAVFSFTKPLYAETLKPTISNSDSIYEITYDEISFSVPDTYTYDNGNDGLLLFPDGNNAEDYSLMVRVDTVSADYNVEDLINTYKNIEGVSLFSSKNTHLLGFDGVVIQMQQKLADNNTMYYRIFSFVTKDTEPKMFQVMYGEMSSERERYSGDFTDLVMSITKGNDNIESLKKDIPVVTFDKLLNEEFKDQTVSVEATVDYYYDQKLYVLVNCEGLYKYLKVYLDYLPRSNYKDLSKGDHVIITGEPNGKDGFEIVYDIVSDKKIDFETIMSDYIDQCTTLDYDTVARDPDAYKNNEYKVEGTVYYVIEESDYSAAYLLKLGDGNYVYISDYRNKDIRGERVLEDDHIIVTGLLEGTKDFILGGSEEKLNLSVYILDIQ